MQHQDRSHQRGGQGWPIDFALDVRIRNRQPINGASPLRFSKLPTALKLHAHFLLSIFQIMSKETHENVYLDFTVHFFA